MLPGCLPWLPNPFTPGRPSTERSRHSRTHDEKTLVARHGRRTDGRAQPLPQTPGAIHGHEVRRHDPDAEVDLRREAHRLHSQLRLRFPERAEGMRPCPKARNAATARRKSPSSRPSRSRRTCRESRASLGRSDAIAACHGFTNKHRSVLVSRSAPECVTSTVSLSDTPFAEVYMWKTMPASSRHWAFGVKQRVKSLDLMGTTE